MTPPKWIKPQLCKLATHAPSGPRWVHEIKFDGYRIAARIAPGKVQLLTRSGLDWTAKYPATVAALTKLPVRSAYLDGELCAVRQTASWTSASCSKPLIAAAPASSISGSISSSSNGEPIAAAPPPGIDFSAHEACDGGSFRRAACRHGLEGVVSKRIDKRYLPGDRSAWIKTKCLNRRVRRCRLVQPRRGQDPISALLLAYHDDNGRLLYAGRVGTGMSQKTLSALHALLAPLAVKTSPSPSRHRARHASAVASRCRASIGFDPSSSPKSSI